MRKTELGQPQIIPRRRQILGTQADAGVDITLALGEEVQNIPQPVIVAGEVTAPSVSARECGQLLPSLHGEPTILGKSILAEHVRIERRGPVEDVVFPLHLARE